MTEAERVEILKPDLKKYLAEHYGICIADMCQCLKTGWLGSRCPNWQPVKSTNWDELIKETRGK